MRHTVAERDAAEAWRKHAAVEGLAAEQGMLLRSIGIDPTNPRSQRSISMEQAKARAQKAERSELSMEHLQMSQPVDRLSVTFEAIDEAHIGAASSVEDLSRGHLTLPTGALAPKALRSSSPPPSPEFGKSKRHTLTERP